MGILIEIFVWVVFAGFSAILLGLPIFLFTVLFDVITRATVNNILVLIARIPYLGKPISGVIATAIAVIWLIFGVILWINYLLIFVRCLGGAKA